MKKIILSTILILLALATFYRTDDQQFQNTPISAPQENLGVAAKHGPADHYFLQKTYPDNKFSQKAYLNGMKSVTEQARQRDPSPGFDTDWTTQGPGNAGARVNVVLVHPNDPATIYLGYSGGGLFKTTDNGTTWNPVFDDQPYLAIGDMAFHPNDPETIFVGTGDPSITGYPFIGNGIYKTTDGGNTWTNLGLSETYIISKIIVHPANPNIIYAGTMGLPFERNNDRGLYKSSDGGQTWNQVLFIDNETGIIDLVIHPANPDIIFAGIWTRIRNNQESKLTGLGHKVYRSTDAGANWQPIGNGLPIGNGGRISLSQSQQNPNTFFACFTSLSHQFDGIFKTTDNGDSWTEIADPNTPFVSNCLFGFGWYLGRLRVNPFNEDEMFVLGVPLVSSVDGGVTWGEAAPFNVHVDNHGIAFANDGSVILGNDGGAYRRPPGGGTVWEDIENIPATQVYRVGYNPFEPDTYYGGFQDNGTQSGAASTINDWTLIRGADGFQTAFNPDDSLNYYAQTQNGGIGVTNNGSNFSSGSGGIISSDRRNWDMQYFISPHNSNSLYTGTFRVYKTTERGLNWMPISPDLTDGVIFSPNFHTISAIDESPTDQGTIYVGTTDANVWRTTDDGENWEEIKQGLPERYVTSVKASPVFSEMVYTTFSGYRDNENTPYVFRSENGGNTWENIAGDLPPIAVNDIIILPGHQDTVLIVGNDAGVYASVNAGLNWERLGGNFPTVPVYDLVYNVKNNQVVAGSHGRSILSFELDNIGLFESIQITGAVRDWQDRTIPNVAVSTTHPAIATQVTGADGQYNFARIPVDAAACEINLRKNTRAVNGVGILDIIELQRHLLEYDTLKSPYQWLAADVNLSRSLTPLDLISIRRVILVIDTVFSATESWRFVPDEFIFTDSLNPWLAEIPWNGNCSDISQAADTINFVAIKMGDVSGNADPDLLQLGDTREPVIFSIPDQEIMAGKEYTFSIPKSSLSGVMGFASQLVFDPSVVSLLEVAKGSHESQNFLLSDKINDIANGIWTGIAGSLTEQSLDKLSNTYSWKIIAKKSGYLSDAIRLTPNYPSHALMTSQERRPLVLEFTGKPVIAVVPDLQTVTIAPNPFVRTTRILLSPHPENPVTIKVLNQLGQSVFEKQISPSALAYHYSLNEDIFRESGVYWLSIQEKDKKILKKLIKI